MTRKPLGQIETIERSKNEATHVIGSSTGLLPFANALRENLALEFSCSVWDNGVFSLSTGSLERLLAMAKTCDVATFILGTDDLALQRNRDVFVPRDNVVFELGMFMGALARDRCFFLSPSRERDFGMPTDLDGITSARFPESSESAVAIDAAANDIRASLAALRSTHSLSGTWLHSWTTGSGREECELDLLQLGSYIRGTYEWKNMHFEVRGQIGTRALNGEYRCTTVANGYSGTLHLRLNARGLPLQGAWAGWSDSSGIHVGECTWTRKTVA